MSWMQTVDDLGFKLDLEAPPRRIVSLVPSWTETFFAFGMDAEIVGVTRFCVEPAAAVAAVPKIGGTKNPDLKAIIDLKPDLVIANAEENRREDIERLRADGVAVFTTYPRTVGSAVESILKLGSVVGRPAEAGAMAREIVRSVSESVISACHRVQAMARAKSAASTTARSGRPCPLMPVPFRLARRPSGRCAQLYWRASG